MRKLALALLAVLPVAGFSAAMGQTVEHPLHMGGEVSKPKVLHDVTPNCPKRKTSETTYAHYLSVSLVIDDHGTPQRVRILESSGSDEVDQCFLNAVRQYRFEPARLKGVPVCVDMNIELNIDFY